MKNISCIILFFFTYSCTNYVKNMQRIGGKEFMSAQGPLFSSSKLILKKDSSFVYTEGGPAVKFSKGYWKVNEKEKTIQLRSEPGENHVVNNLVDTLYLNLNNVKVKIINKKKVEMNDTILFAKQ